MYSYRYYRLVRRTMTVVKESNDLQLKVNQLHTLNQLIEIEKRKCKRKGGKILLSESLLSYIRLFKDIRESTNKIVGLKKEIKNIRKELPNSIL